MDLFSPYLCSLWLLPVCALSGELTRDRGVSGQRSNQLSHPAGARKVGFGVRVAGATPSSASCQLCALGQAGPSP